MKKLKQMYRCIGKGKYRNNKTKRCPTVLLRVPLGHDRQYGFTLVELVIVIAIVIILSVISVPIYRGYVDKAKYSEAYALLGNILSAQKAYYSQYGNFLRAPQGSAGNNWVTANEEVLGIDARGNKYFTSFYVNAGAGVGRNERAKYFFQAAAFKPEDLVSGDNHCFLLQYNITKGSRIVEYNVAGIDFDAWL